MMNTRRFHFVLIALLLVTSMGCNDSRNNLFLHGLSLQGFEQEGPLAVYNRENIFDYIDGEADAYFPHGFRLLYTLNFRQEKGDALMIVDAYDMSTRRGARAIFKKFSEEGGMKIDGLGEAAITDTLTILIQRGRYFVRILPSPSAEEKVDPKLDDMLLLGRMLDGALRHGKNF